MNNVLGCGRFGDEEYSWFLKSPAFFLLGVGMGYLKLKTGTYCELV